MVNIPPSIDVSNGSGGYWEVEIIVDNFRFFAGRPVTKRETAVGKKDYVITLFARYGIALNDVTKQRSILKGQPVENETQAEMVSAADVLKRLIADKKL